MNPLEAPDNKEQMSSRVVEPKSGWGLVGLYSATLFLSALLLFSVQPIFAKMILPLLGGAPAVWNTAMLFYQAALLAGYAYAHWASRSLSPRAHLISHLALLAAAFLFLPFAVPKGSEPTGGANPIPWLLVTMAAGVGVPFFVVSTTGPLLQRWFSWTGHRASADPYFLYAASNLGSMLGLLGYPFLIEPSLRLREQSVWWAAGFGLLFVGIAVCVGTLRRSAWLAGRLSDKSDVSDGSTSIPWSRRVRWVALAFVPSSLMLGVTQFMSTDVASVPLLWVVPLALYLLTFTIVFARRPILPHKAALVLMPIFLGLLMVVMLLEITKPLLPVVLIHLAAFFFIAMMCHGEMAKDRPSVKHLTEFYLWMSVGGVLGGFFNAIVSPLAFPLVVEYPLALALGALLFPGKWGAERPRVRVFDFLAPAIVVVLVVAALALEKRYGLTSSTRARMMILGAGVLGALLLHQRPLRFGLAVAGLLGLGLKMWLDDLKLVYLERSFFGVTRIEKRGMYTDIYHGTTLHGTQNEEERDDPKPKTYYYPTGPAGLTLSYMNRPPEGHYAVVGLGAGTLAAYSGPGESWTFYEIDPVIEKVAKDARFFTYLSKSKGRVNVVLGDARVSLRGSKDRYEAILLDAYSSDAVPIHLLTREAVSVYLDHLQPQGILAFHISNKHLDLAPVVHELCKDAGLVGMRFIDRQLEQEEKNDGKTASEWVIAYRPGTPVEAILEQGKWEPTRGKAGVGLWTDDFSSIWTVYDPTIGK